MHSNLRNAYMKKRMINYQRKRKSLRKLRFLFSKISAKHRACKYRMLLYHSAMEEKAYRFWQILIKYYKLHGIELANTLERSVTLFLIDDAWKEHLRAMDDLKQSVQTAHYEQKDPLVIYKGEAFNLFSQMSAQVSKNIVSFLSHAELPVQQNAPDTRSKNRKNRHE